MLFSTLFLASTASATCLHGLSMFKRAEEAGAKAPSFGYGPLDGPLNWASLKKENEACRAGKNQSPINLDKSLQVLTEKPKLNVAKGTKAIFSNLGTTIQVSVNGTTSYAGTDYQLVQFHVHTPSEHHVEGEYHPLELHMVHQGVADKTKLAVIALMFEVAAGESSSIIRSLSSSLPKVSTFGAKVEIPGGIDFCDAKHVIESSQMVTYSGSLTTPPCAEGVRFLIVKDPLDISVADFNAIKKIVKFNARLIQSNLGEANLGEVCSVAGTAKAMMPAPVAGSPKNSTTQRRQPKY